MRYSIIGAALYSAGVAILVTLGLRETGLPFLLVLGLGLTTLSVVFAAELVSRKIKHEGGGE